MKTLVVTVFLKEYLVAVLQSAASANPTQCKYRLSLKDEVPKINTPTNDDRKQNFYPAISAFSNPNFKHI